MRLRPIAGPYGYNIVTLYADGVKVARCMGGGYDMRGTCLGNYIQDRFQAELLAISDRKDFYGMTYYETRQPHVVLDGATGFDSMVRVLETIGYHLSNMRTKNRDIFLLGKD